MTPIDMLLWCPLCGAQHVDEIEKVDVTRMESPAPEAVTTWDNPPHRSHLCHACGSVWRPADVCTNGVRSLATKGARDSFDSTNALSIPERSGPRWY